MAKAGWLLDQVFPFGDFERICYAAKIYTSAIAPALPTDGTRA